MKLLENWLRDANTYLMQENTLHTKHIQKLM